MTIAEITQALDEIERSRDDDETAHVLQDRLYGRVLQAIADGARRPAALAAEALKAREIQFARWYA